MTRLLQTRDQLVYPPQVVSQESQWAYLQSFSQRPFNSRDVDAPNYKVSGAAQSAHPAHPYSAHGAAAGGNLDQPSGPSQGTGNRGRKEPIDRFASIIDAEDPRFEKQRRDNQKVWEGNISGICNSMNRSMDAFYSRKTKLYHYVVSNTISERDSLTPQVDVNESLTQIQDIAQAPWIFQSLPGTKPAQWEKDPSQLESLVERLEQLPAGSLWREPLDVICGGPEFFAQVQEFVLSTGEQLNQEVVPEGTISKVLTLESNALVAMFGVAAHMASYEKLLLTLQTMHQLSRTCSQADAVIEHAQPQLKRYLQQIVDFVDNQKSLHHFQQNSINGVISVAKHFSMVNLTENTCSLTTDGAYLYLLISATGRGQLMKIGSGEKGTLAGKVYASEAAEKEGDMTWVYCQGKLYARRANEELGTISVIDPESLKGEGVAKLYFGDQFQNPTAQSLNRYYPLLTDGRNLFTVTMSTTTKRRKVKDGMRKIYQSFQEHKRRAKEENSKEKQLKQAQSKEATEKEKAQGNVHPSVKLVNKVISEQELKLLLQAGDPKSLQRIYSVIEQEAMKEMSVALGDGKVAQMSEKEKQSHLKMQKHQVKQTLREAKKHFQKLAQEAQADKDKGKSAPQPAEKKAAEADIEQYSVCEFWVHEFDVQGQAQEDLPIKELLQNELVVEMFNSFSGFFTYEECFRALKFHSDDIAEAVAWLVDQGEKERGKKSLQRKRTVLLAESELLEEMVQATKKNEVELVVKKDSVLLPSCISTGKWTISNNQISYHSLQSERGFVNVFSLHQEDQRIINLKEIQKLQEENPPNNSLEKLTSQFLAQAEWHESISEANPSAGSKALAASAGDISSAAEKLEVQSQKSESNVSSAGGVASETIEFAFSEEDFYEEVKLYGTFLKTVKLHRSSDFNMSSYLTYDHTQRKFYMLMIGSNMRYIAVAQDLQQMGSLLSEVIFNLETDATLFESKPTDEKVGQDPSKKGAQPLQPHPSERQREVAERQGREIQRLLAQEMKTISEFMVAVLAVLKHASRNRFNLPWRWRPWSYVYSLATSAWINSQEQQSEESEESRKAIEQRKKQEAKLKNRIDKVIAVEQAAARKRLGIEYEEPPKLKDKPKATQVQPKAEPAKLKEQTKSAAPSKMKAEEKKTYTGKDASIWNTFEYNQKNNLFGENKQNPAKSQSKPAEATFVVPKEKLINQIEVKKLFAFASSGSVETLELLLSLLRDQSLPEALRDSLLNQTLDWLSYADILSNLYGSSLVDDLRELILDFITSSLVSSTQVRQQLLWKCLIVGWALFAKNTQVLHRMFALVLIHSQNYSQKLKQLPLCSYLSTGSLPKASDSFYQKVFGLNDLSPIELFHTRFYSYSASFFPLEVLLQATVKNFVILVDNVEGTQRPEERRQSLTNPFQQAAPKPFGQSAPGFKKVAEVFKDSHLRPRYDSFYQVQTSFQNQVNENLSAKHQKVLTELEIDVGTVHYHFFNVPNFLLFCNQYEVVENVYGYKSTLPFEKLTRYYSEEKPLFEADDSDEVKHNKQVNLLHRVRSQQIDSSSALLYRIQDLVLSYVEQPSEGDSAVDAPFVLTLMKVYNQLIRFNLDQIDYSSSKETKYSISQLRFVDACLSTLMKKTLLAKIEPTQAQVDWFSQLLELIHTTVNIVFDVVNFENQACFCKDATDYLLKIIENLKLVFMIPRQSGKAGDSALQFQSLLQQACVFQSEGADFTYEKVFETSHPYPRIESLQKDSVSSSRAIAYTVEFDRRCQTESSNDSLVLYSQDHAYWINDTFGTQVKFYGKYQSKYPVMILGNRVNIEFRSFTQGKKQPARGRGGYYMAGGAPGGPAAEDPQARWGYKLYIRPIYDEPSFFMSSSHVKSDLLKPVYRRMGDYKHFQFTSLLNQLYYTASKFARSVTSAREIPQWLNYLQMDENPFSMGGQPNPTGAVDSLVQTNPLLQAQQSLQQNQESLRKYLSWHLFKGGLRTSLLEELHNPSSLDEFLEEELKREELLCQQAYQELEKYQPQADKAKQLAIEGEEVKTEELQKVANLAKQGGEARDQFMREGEKVQVKEFESIKHYWTQEVAAVIQDAQLMEKILKRVRELVPYSFVFNNEKKKPSFKKSYQEDWQLLEQQIIVVMLYHSHSLDEVASHLGAAPNSSPSKAMQNQALSQGVQEKLTLIGTQVNDILGWMQSRLQGEQDFQMMLKDVAAHSQTHIDKVIAKKKQEQEEKRKLDQEAQELERQKQQQLNESQEKQRQAQQQQEEEKVASKKGPVVSKSKAVKHSKRKNVVKIAAPKVDLAKIQKEKSLKEQEKQLKLQQKEQEAKLKLASEKSVIEPSKEGVEKAEKQKIKYLELPKAEENEIKNKIYNKVYEDFLQLYQGNQDRVKPLCLLLNLQFNAEDPNESLRSIFRRVKQKLAPLIDFDGDMPLRETIDIDELKLESPYQEIRKDVQQRILFLLELKPSLDYHSKVVRVDSKALQKRFQLQTHTLSQLSVDDQYNNDTDSQNPFNESSLQGDDDSELLEPLGIQRSQSVQVGLQQTLSGIAGVSQAVIAEQTRMKDAEIASWIDNYRKWRQWNRQHNLIHRQHGAITDSLLEEDLTSPFCSPLFSIVSFAKSSKIIDPDQLRQIFFSHQVKAAFRSAGLKLHERLLSLTANTPFQRLAWGNLSITLAEGEVMGEVETAGEKLAQQINENSRQILKQLVKFVIKSQQFIGNYIYKKRYSSSAFSKSQDKKASSSAKPLPQQQLKSQQQKMSSIEDWLVYEQLRRLISYLNDIRVLLNNVYTREYILESLRKTPSPTLAQFKSPVRKERLAHQTSTVLAKPEETVADAAAASESEEGMELNQETLHRFLKSVITLMQYTSNSSYLQKTPSSSTTKLQFQVSNCCKIILNQVMSDKSMMRSADTQRLMQEMLLDIVVQELENKCGISQKKSSSNQSAEEVKQSAQKEESSSSGEKKVDLQKIVGRINSITFSEEIVQLLKMLSEVIRISDDQSQFNADLLKQQTTSDQESTKEAYFLTEGSDKVMRCAQILAFLIHNTEIPIVMRQTLKCARLFFKLVDFKKLQLHYPTVSLLFENQLSSAESSAEGQLANQFLLETLLKIGQKVSNTQLQQQQIEEQKDEAKTLETTQIDTSASKPAESGDSIVATKSQEAAKDEKLYVVYGNINSSEEDFSYLITALYHWENMYPVITPFLPSDPAEITVKSKPKPPPMPAEEEKKDGQAAAADGNQEKPQEEKEEVADKVKQLAKEKEKGAAADGVSHEPLGKRVLDQILNEEGSEDLIDLITLQRQQQEMNSRGRGRGGRGGYYGGRGGAAAALSSYAAPQAASGQEKMSKYSYHHSSSKPPVYFTQSTQVISNSLSLAKVDQVFQEIVKATHEDCKEEDTPEEQMRKLNESNYNIRVQAHIKDALSLAAVLHQRYSAPLSEPLPLQKAIEFSTIMKKAYNGQLSPVGINPFLKDEFKEKKLSNQKSVSQCFPLMVAKIEPSKKGRDLPPGAGASIVIAPKQFVVSIAEMKVAQKYETIVETKGSSLKSLEKSPADGFACNVISHSIRRQGASISVIVQHYVNLLRSLITKQKRGSHRLHAAPLHKQSFITTGDKFNKNQSLQKIKKQEQVFGEEMIQVLNHVLRLLTLKQWPEFSASEKQMTFGILTVIGGWYAAYRSGQSVQVEINNQWVDAIVVDDGLGKKRLSVILEDDDTLQVQKVLTTKARANQKYEWPFQSQLSEKIDQELLSQCVVEVFRWIQTADIQSQLSANPSQSKLHLLKDEESQIELSEGEFLLMQLLKVTSQIPWSSKGTQSIEKQREFVKLLTEISNLETKSVEKSQAYLEKQLVDSWERLIDKDESRNNDFFVLREHPPLRLVEAEEVKEEKKQSEEAEKLDLNRKLSAFKQELQNQFVDSEYVQPLSSYLKGLPEPVPKKNQSEAALKLLAHWDKHVIPKIVDFVRTTYKSWEMEFYFEQLRHHLRNGDQARALEDAMTMCERKLPQGCIIPDDSHDWTAKMADECIVDSWALAKIKPQRVSSSQGGQQGSAGASDTNYPLLNKLINLGIDEFVVLIKAVDNRSNVVLAEYQDPDTMQVHSIWVPISYLSDLQCQLPPRAVGYSVQTLRKAFDQNTTLIEKVYAKQTLIKYFESTLSNKDRDSGEDLIQLKDIINWCVQEKYCENPVEGWMQELTSAIPLASLHQSTNLPQETPVDNSEEINTDNSMASSNLQDMIQGISDQLALENLIRSTLASESGAQSSALAEHNTLGLIKQLIGQKLAALNHLKTEGEVEASADFKRVQGMVDWCCVNWFTLAESIRSDRIAMDLCQQYDKYINSAALKSLSQGASSQLMPLHSLMPTDDSSYQSQAAAILIMFKKNAAQLTPTSKIQFYADPDKVHLVSEISTGQEGKKDLPPLLLNHGQIWVSIDSGTTALLPKHMQTELSLSLPCAIVVVPRAWTVCCWLTETLSNSVLAASVSSHPKLAIEVYSKLIGALTAFYLDSKAPSMLKSITFTLLTRLLRKLRHLYRTLPEEKETAHLEQLFVKQDFIDTLLCELLLFKEQEEQAAMREGIQNSNILYPAFVQDSVELLITIMLPTLRSKRIESYRELIAGSRVNLPEWLQPLIKVAYFMHYFQSEMPLTVDLLREIYDQTKLTEHSTLDQIIVLQGIPTDEEKYPKLWVRGRICDLIAKHGGRVLNPANDVVFPSKDTAVIIVDGFNNMTFVNDEDGKLAAIVDSDAENEEADKMGAKKIEEQKEEPPAMPTEYSCAICTFLNAISKANCEICATPRPPMEVIIAEFQSQINPSSNNKGENKEGEENKKEQEDKKSPTLVRMEHLAAELTLLIKREERRVLKEKQKREEEELKAREAEEKAQKEKEELERKEREMKQKEEEAKKKGGSASKSKAPPQEPKPESSKRDKKGKKQRQQAQQRESPPKARESGMLFDIQRMIESDLQAYEQEISQLQREDPILSSLHLMHQQEDYRLATEMSNSHPSQPSNLVTQLNIESIPDSHNDNSFEALVMENNEYANDDAGWGVDNQNLSEEQRRERTRQRLLEMGMDAQMLEQDPDLLEALLESMMAEEQIARQKAAEQRQEEYERRKKQLEEEEKRRKKEEEEKKRQEMGEEAYQALKPKYTKLKVSVGKAVVFEGVETSRLVFNFLRSRLMPQSAEPEATGAFQFSAHLVEVLTTIHKNHQLYPANLMTPLPCELEDLFEITTQSLKELSTEEFIEQCKLVVEADVKLFMVMLETQGYDFWFQRVVYPTYLPDSDSNDHKMSIGILEKLKTFIEMDMCRETKGVQTLIPTELRLISKMPREALRNPSEGEEPMSPVNYYNDSQLSNSYPEINENLSLADVRYIWSMLKTFNRYLAPAVPYINTSSYSSSSNSGGAQSGIPSHSIPLTLAAYMSFSRNLCLMNVKFDLRHLILEKTSVAREQQQSQVPKVYFERLKLAHRNREFEEAAAGMGSLQEDRGSPQRGQERDSNHASAQNDPTKSKDKRLSMDFMFMQAFEQIKEMDLAQLRPKKPSGAEPHLSFHVIFRGEHVVGEAGPYRQFFADISQELQPNNLAKNPNQKLLGLLYPSPNNRAAMNIGKGKFVLSPSRNTSQDLSLFEFLGIIMGACIRTGAHLNLDLPQFVWKQLVGEKVSHEDLVEIDLGFYKLLSYMLSAPQKLYSESIFEAWNALTLSDETIISLQAPALKPKEEIKGQAEEESEQKVEFEDRVEFVRQALRARLTECALQCEAIKRGIIKIVPEALLNMVTYQELETWVCGKNIVDVDLLKRHTKYGGDKKTTILNEESRRIKYFWEVLREFTEEDKQKFIKFCWGQQRLPANDEEFERRQVRFMIKPAMKNTHGDGALPKADTCFFNLELPDYSTKEVMKQRILLAIYTDSDSMNAEAEHAANIHINDPMMGGGPGGRGPMHQNLDQSYDDEY